MEDLDQKISELEARIDRLVRTQIGFQTEITALREELKRLRGLGSEAASKPRQTGSTEPPQRPASASTEPPLYRPPIRSSEGAPGFTAGYSESSTEASPSPDPVSQFFSKHTEAAQANLEKFIGENLISKIGILVLIIGVGIGVKYSIDNNLISPLTRVILAYLFAFGLVGLAIKLKPKYHNFSAALISGGMAIMYFVTYFAYTTYSLINQGAAFGLMTMFTVLTVVAALFYNRQVIAHIGLVGAYAVPFLLSSDSGNYLALFTYMAIINAGILAISVKRYWRPLFYTASGFTWLIFAGWFAAKYSYLEHFGLALVFLGTFSAIFLATKLIHITVHSEHDDNEALASACVTVFIFYAFCFAISDAALDVRQLWSFFAYLAVATTAIMVISLRFFGKFLVYLAFAFAWFVYGVWYANRYFLDEHFFLASIFAAVFFIVFYATVLIHRLATEDFSLIENAGLVLTNSFLFYGFGYSILSGNESTANYLGLYTAGHSLLHLGVAHFINRARATAIDVVQVLTILVLTFASMAIPVQFDGNQVTMIWSVEAALLFWFGRAKGVRLFEYFSCPVMVLAAGSLFFDWVTAYFNRTSYPSEFNLQPFANGNFVTALVFIAAFAFIFAVNRDKENESAITPELVRPFGYVVAGLAIFALYNAYRIEIGNYFHLQSVDLREIGAEPLFAQLNNIDRLNAIWQINYTMLFLAAMAFVNLRKARSAALAYVNTGLGTLTLGLFATVGMVLFYEMRLSYLAGEGGYGLVSIRYISYVTAAVLMFAIYTYSRNTLMTERVPARVLSLGFEALFYKFCFIVASCELVSLMAQFGIPDGTKLGLSIFWGIYALMLIVIGIAWSKKHLRIAAIVLIAVTLAKLFFYDVAELDTIPRTILFVTLGLTLLVISFLYNKYKTVIFGFGGESEE